MTMEEQPKRAAPKPVAPVEIDQVRYEVVRRARARGFGQDGGVIAAIDLATGKELWTLVVYRTAHDKNEERDVQERYITRLSPANDHAALRVEDEARRAFLVDLKTREVSQADEK
ncbi:MAG: PQQ-binding-like beta-propeller repeat protein [Deltaproteobacteria bacterium]|nr:PQQ-binding-like beta-propeller repeat protein [Deltaproteobacteria bacterium]